MGFKVRLTDCGIVWADAGRLVAVVSCDGNGVSADQADTPGATLLGEDTEERTVSELI